MALHHLPPNEPTPDRARWGIQLVGAAAPGEESSRESASPEPLDWRPPIPLGKRIVRAIATPAALGAAAFVVAVLAAIVMVALQPHTPADEVAGSAAAAEASRGDASAAAEGIPEATTGVEGGARAAVWVHVVGAVNQPGVVELESGARVQAALEAAGGATEAAVLSGVNLARTVVDGEQIFVPDTEHPVPPPQHSGGGSVSGPAGGAVINLNTADSAALESLPRVGPSLAQRIIDWRTSNGPFISVEQLLEVSGIGPTTLDGFRDRVGVG